MLRLHSLYDREAEQIKSEEVEIQTEDNPSGNGGWLSFFSIEIYRAYNRRNDDTAERIDAAEIVQMFAKYSILQPVIV